MLRDVLEAHQVLAGAGEVARLLVGTRQSKLRRGVQRVQLQRVLKGIDRLRKLLDLRVSRAQEVPGVGVIGIDFGNATESIDG